ncbi:MAG TPA: hypothetical protein VMX38_02750 [Verrucomicrobiae bacterium]|nr:hypothetical protein [Verrucomicrobiae bacterium]
MLRTMLMALMALAALAGFEGQSQTNPEQSSSKQSTATESKVMIPAGTRLALVLTQPIESRLVRRGDNIYAQVNAPVTSGDGVVIPAGTFVQGTVEKISRSHGRGEVRLESMAITFPDGYVTPISGPITLETDEGYALNDPGPGRSAIALAAPIGGAGIGALIGHSIGSSPSTITSSVPPGCTGPPPGCLTSSVTGPSNAGRNTAIGSGVGVAVGGVVTLALLLGSHHFFLEAGAPVQMRLEAPVSLRQDEVSKAVQQSAEHPAAVQPAAPLPIPYVPPDMPVNNGTCWTPGTPGTPPTVIPGAPGPDGIPGPPTVIPGTPPTPGTPYPCPQ